MASTATVTELKPRTSTGRQKRRPVTVGEAIEQMLVSPTPSGPEPVDLEASAVTGSPGQRNR